MMLRSLLVDRFGLAFHMEKQELPIYALTISKGGPINLHEPAPDETTSMELDPADTRDGTRWKFHNQPLSAAAGLISNGLSRPLLDMTGLGRFDFAFLLPVRDPGEKLEDYDLLEVFPALQRQLGIRVVPQTAPIEVFVVDRLAKTPTAN